MTEQTPTDTTPLEGVAFPHPRADCITAVQAARSYIHDHGQTAKDELVDALAPVENHRIGVAAAQALGKLCEHDAYRRWWWRSVVEPGLEALPDIERTAPASGTWQPAASTRPGTHADAALPTASSNSEDLSLQTVRATLEEGPLFTLTYRADGERQQAVVTVEETVDAAATVPTSPSTFRFQVVNDDTELQLSLSALVHIEPVALDVLAPSQQQAAVAAIRSAAESKLPDIPLATCRRALELTNKGTVDADDALSMAWHRLQRSEDDIEALADPLFAVLGAGEGPMVWLLLRWFADRATTAPTWLAAHTDVLATLTAESEYSATAARCLSQLAEANPAAVLDTIPLLATTAETPGADTRKQVIHTFTLVAKSYPEELLPALNVLVEAIRRGDENCQTNALSAVGRIAGSYPDAATSIVDEVVPLLDDEEPQVRANAVGLLGDIAREHPALVVEHASAIAQRLADANADTRRNASIALLRAGEADPPAVAAEHEHLAAALHDAVPLVRANACLLIGNSEAPVSTETLRTLRDSDPDETVRQRASWALTQLS